MKTKYYYCKSNKTYYRRIGVQWYYFNIDSVWHKITNKWGYGYYADYFKRACEIGDAEELTKEEIFLKLL